MATVSIQQLVKEYRDDRRHAFTAVKGIDLEIRDREFMVLVGPSGCGKSTTLRMIAGLEDITAGTIAIDGRIVNDLAPKDRDIAMVFQNYALYPHMSVYDNMAFGLKLRKLPREQIRQRVHEAAEILGLEELLERRPKALSGGQRQRVAVGRALVRQPKVFLFDEPLSNLDAKMRVQMRAEISRLHRRLDATMIYVTHDQTEAMTMGERICVMKDGHIMQVDEPLSLYHAPANQFTAGFIGSPPMNFFRGQIVREGERMAFVEDNSAAAPFRLTLTEEVATLAAPRAGKGVVLGVRAEDFSLVQAGTGTPGEAAAHRETSGEENLLRVRVDMAEPMGAETFLTFDTGAHRFVARVPGGPPCRAGEELALAPDLAKARLFDPESGEALG
jgi:multiple sugar transport system ATP-binding protein